MSWLIKFAESAERTDRLIENPEHVRLLAAGLMGEAGSVLTELKKEERERNAYPSYRRKMHEEIGDLLWYFTRIVTVVDRDLLHELALSAGDRRTQEPSLPLFLDLGVAVGEVLEAINNDKTARSHEMPPLLRRLWNVLLAVAQEAPVALQEAAASNIVKIESRWPQSRDHHGLFDDDFPEEEQLPRQLEVEFRERERDEHKVVLLRCNNINFGDRLTDNIEDPDGYRYHDIFHFAYAVHLGWSPVVRALLKCKRKSSSKKDEGQDGARAVILEEAVSAIVFSRAKELADFDGRDHVDYDLLKTVREFVQGFEVADVPLWQWEAAILDGYSVFRKLRHRGGKVILDLYKRELKFIAPT